MHRTCHAANSVNVLRASPGSASERQIHRLMGELAEAHHLWRERQVVRKGDDREQMDQLVEKASSDRDGTSNQSGAQFLDYTPVHSLLSC